MFKEDISPLQLYTSRDFSGLTESNHLAQAYLTEPERMEGVLAYAFGMTNNNVLNLLTDGLGNVRFTRSRQYKWKVHGQTELVVDIGKDSTGGSSTPGLGGSPVTIYLKENHYESTDNLRLDDGTMVRVKSEPHQEGNFYAHVCQLVDTDKDYIDPDVLGTSNQVSKLYSTVEEYSTKGGGTNYSTPVELINQLTTLRKHYDVSRNAAKEAMIVELRHPEDPSMSTKMWTQLAEWTAMAQWQKEIDRSMVYTTFSSDPVKEVKVWEETSRPVYTGAGFRQQIAPSNTQFYSQLTYDLLQDFLTKLSYSSTAWGGNTKFLGLTGKMGMQEFHNAVTEKSRSLGITVTDTGTFISGSGQELTFQGQFTSVKFLNGVELTMKVFDPYDDLKHNRKLHPVSKKPLESYRITILNFGRKDGVSNIRKVALEDSENLMWHVAGSVDPFGGTSKSIGTMRSSSRDGYRVEFLGECGIQLQDPTSAGELIIELD